MKFEFPDTGEGVTEGKFLEWLVEEGDSVQEDEAVAEVETDKAVIDVPAPSDGVIKELMVSPGDNVKVGEVILEIDTGETVEEAEGGSEEQDNKEEKEETTDSVEDSESSEEEQENEEDQEAEIDDSETLNKDVLALPKVRKLAEDLNVNIESLEKDGRITEEDIRNASDTEEVKETTEQSEKEEIDESEQKVSETESIEESENKQVSTSKDVMATPATRKFAREKRINLEEVEGTGKGGRITRTDVKAAAGKDTDRGKSDKEPEKTLKHGNSPEEVEKIEMSGIRKTVGRKMKESKDKIPHVTHMDKADITELHELRERKKEEVEPHLTYLPFIMKAASEALKEHPNLNAELDEENDQIKRYGDHNFNMAVDTEDGLMVPLVENVKEKNILQLASDIVEKAEAARERDLSREEMRNGTFSVTNVGAIGGEYFTPIISHPQVAILGVGRIEETAEVVDGEVEPRMTVKLSLSYDHRVIDGADAASFMNDIIENLEDPESMVLRL